MIGVDLFYTTFAVIFILEATKENALPPVIREQAVSIEVPWVGRPGIAHEDCVILLEVTDGFNDKHSTVDPMRVAEEEDGKCRVTLPAVPIVDDEPLRLRAALLKYPLPEASEATIRVGLQRKDIGELGSKIWPTP